MCDFFRKVENFDRKLAAVAVGGSSNPKINQEVCQSPLMARKMIICASCGERKPHGARGECTACARRTYVKSDPEKIKLQKQAHYLKHQDRLKDLAKARYAADPDKNLEGQRRRRKDNPEATAEWSRRSYEKNCEAIKARARDYYRRHPEVALAAGIKYRQIKDGVTFGLVDLKEVWARSDAKCHICGEEVDVNNFHYDHVIPLSKGGWHTTSNLQIAHPFCNISKKNKLFYRAY